MLRRWKRGAVGLLCTVVLVTMAAWQSWAQKPAASESPAKLILASLADRNGLGVQLGLRDGKLATALSDNGRLLVHGLTENADAVDRAREDIAAAGLAGLVSVEQASLERLPYANRLVNLLVVDDLEAALEAGLSISEVQRVLCPGGVAWFSAADEGELKKTLADAGIKQVEIVRGDRPWAHFTAARPQQMDQWTHARHAADGNPVSRDELVSIPTGVRWAAGPNWPTGYRKSAVPSRVASEQRLVYVFEDEVDTPDGAVRQNSLVCRDAYNGLLLWKRKASDRLAPLIADGDRIFTVLDDGALVALDARTGEVIREYPSQPDAKGVLYLDGLLIANLEQGVGCLDANDGSVKWSLDFRPAEMVAGDGRVYVHSDDRRRGGDSQFICLDAQTGKELWSANTKGWTKSSPALLLHDDGTLVASSPEGTHAISAADGKLRWSYKYPLIGHGGSFSKVLSMNGLVWVHVASFKDQRQYAWEGLDPVSGKVQQRVVQPEEFKMKHRCSYDVASGGRYFMCGSMDFADLESGEYEHFSAARNSCNQAGVLPANGLLYTFPHACGCFPMLRGFLGLSNDPAPVASAESANRLKLGPATDTDSQVTVNEKDWPTYRHDARRSGSTSAPGPTELDELWTADISSKVSPHLANEWSLKDGGRLSAVTVAKDTAYVAASDEHLLMAINIANGQPRWKFTAGGRIDCPPTLHAGLCLVGSRDGYAYALRAADGALAWSYRAAPAERRIVAYGQLESAWPVVGGVLVHNDLAYAVTGRHTGSDGGLFVTAWKPGGGQVVWSAQPTEYNGVADVLSGEGDVVQMADVKFDALSGATDDDASGLRGGRLGLLNDAWYKHPIAMRKNLQLWQVDGKPSGQLLAFNDTCASGYQACSSVAGGDGKMSGHALLFNEPQKGKQGWSLKLDLTTRLQAMAQTPDHLYVAGRINDDGKPAENAVVRAYALADGKLIAEAPLPAMPVHDGLSIAGGRVFVALENGQLVCLGEK